jgi:hypothetical protein
MLEDPELSGSDIGMAFYTFFYISIGSIIIGIAVGAVSALV